MAGDDFDSDDDETEDGRELWARYTRDITKIPEEANHSKGAPHASFTKTSDKKPSKFQSQSFESALNLDRLMNFETGLKYYSEPEPNQTPQNQIDKRAAMRLKRGQMNIDARVDLHGLYQSEARARLYQFIQQSYNAGYRCILVITGKGQLVFEGEKADERTPGVIKRNFKSWLKTEPYASMILKIEKAQIKDGGEGAYYILLRRKR